jgi:hypothetical protein
VVAYGASFGVAVAGLATNRLPADAFHAGEYHRRRVGRYRVAYAIDDELITVMRADRAPA